MTPTKKRLGIAPSNVSTYTRQIETDGGIATTFRITRTAKSTCAFCIVTHNEDKTIASQSTLFVFKNEKVQIEEESPIGWKLTAYNGVQLYIGSTNDGFILAIAEADGDLSKAPCFETHRSTHAFFQAMNEIVCLLLAPRVEIEEKYMIECEHMFISLYEAIAQEPGFLS